VVVVDFTSNAEAILKAFATYRKGTPFEPVEPDPEACTRLLAEALAAGVFTQSDARELVHLLATGTDAQVQFRVNVLRVRFQAALPAGEDRKAFVHLLARLVKSYHFLSCFFTFPDEVREFVAFAEYVGPQLIKRGNVSELMRQIRQTEVVKAAVEYQGEVRASSGEVKLRPGSGKKGAGPPPKKVSVQEMIDSVREKFDISDEEALYIREVTEEKRADPVIRDTVQSHRENRIFLDTFRGQVNGEIQEAYGERARFEELADPKYTDRGGIFDIMAETVIQSHRTAAA
jgi:type I restriction enzyme R subunit